MRTRSAVLGVVLLICGLCGCGGSKSGLPSGGTPGGAGKLAAATADSTVTAATGAVEGQILDPTGNPLPNATVTVQVGAAAARRGRQSSGDTFTTTTDTNGWFHAGNLPPGHYSLTVQQSGVATTQLEADVVPNQVSTTEPVKTTDAGSAPSASTGRVYGLVKATNGSPVYPAHISVAEANVGADNNVSGGYLLSDLAPGDYHLTCKASGYQDATADGVHVVAGQVTVYNFVLKPAGSSAGRIHGTVRDAGGLPIADVILYAKSGTTAVGTHTDSLGQYAFADLAPGTYQLKGSKQGYGACDGSVTVAAGQDVEQNFTLTQASAATGALAGTVTTTAGAPILGAKIITLVVDHNVQTTSNADGRYQLGELPAGTYRVYCVADGYQPTAKDGIVVTAGQTTTLNFALTATTSTTGVIEGGVLDSNGSPVTGATIVASSTGQTANATTGSNGRYRIEGLAPGEYNLLCKKDGYRNASGTATVLAGKGVTRDFTLQATTAPTGTLAGTVTNSHGELLAGVSVAVQSGSTYKYGSTDTSGHYQLADLPAGTYKVTAGKQPYAPVTVEGVVITAGQTTTQDLVLQVPASGSISGVCQLADGTPVAGATVKCGTSTTLVGTTTSDDQGHYAFVGLAAGTYTVYALKSPLVSPPATVTLTAGATASQNLVLADMSPKGNLHGTVRTPDHALLAEATVKAVAGSTSRTVTTDANGAFALDGLPVGTYTVTAGKVPYNTATVANVAVTADHTTTLEITLPSSGGGTTGGLAGTVTNQDGAAVAGATIYVSNGAGAHQTVTTDTNGHYEHTGLPAGTWFLSATKDPYQAVLLVGLTVTAGQTGTVNVKLGPSNLGQGVATGSLGGIVRAPDGTPVADASVAVTGASTANGKTDTNGRFQFNGLTPGSSYQVYAGKAPYKPVTVGSLYVIAGTLTVVNPTLLPSN